MSVERVFTGAPWERRVGYCRAIRAGVHIYVTGTVAVERDGTPHAPGDPYAQARRALEIILGALNDLGAGKEDVVRTRLYLTDISQWEEVGRAHGEVFSGHPPATTLLQVAALVDPAFLVEIEADAVVGEASRSFGGNPGGTPAV